MDRGSGIADFQHCIDHSGTGRQDTQHANVVGTTVGRGSFSHWLCDIMLSFIFIGFIVCFIGGCRLLLALMVLFDCCVFLEVFNTF